MDKDKRQIGLAITIQSPALLAVGPVAHNLTETLEFISGNTLRGLLAYRYLERGGKAEDAVFQRLFVSGEVRFGAACIEGAGFIPLSARSCKYEGGFTRDPGHGVMDLLLNPDGGVLSCPRCGRSMDYFEGFMDHRKACRRKVKKRLITRTAIDPQRGAASVNRLYSQRVIAEGQTFLSNIEAPDDLAEILGKLVGDGFSAGVGTGVSRGQGWVKVAPAAPSEPDLGEAANRYRAFVDKQRQPVLAVTLLSDGLFTDDYLRDRTAPTLWHLQEPLDIHPEDWKEQPIKAYVATRLLFGFDGAPLQLPRIPRLAVRAGSAFLFTAKERCTPHIPNGSGVGWIGDNTREGYGRAALWHPFHLQPEKSYD